MLWHREDYINLMTFKKPERQLFVELFGPLTGLEKEWERQGAAEDEVNLSAFGFDSVNLYGVGHTGFINTFKEEILEENEDVRIVRDFLGRTCKLVKASASIPLPMDYPVKGRDDWLKIKPKLMFDESRVEPGEIAKAKELQKKGWLINTSIHGGFATVRDLMGDEAACFMYYDDPELMQDIMQTLSDTAYRVLERISSEMVIDHISVHEDMAGKPGPLIGPETVREFIAPYYKRIWDLLHGRGTKLFCQDSDGNMNAVLEAFMDAGVNIFLPMEPAAGMDIVALRKKYGKRAAFKGGIDKHVLRQGKDEILKELQYKMQPLMLEGGTVFGLDHRIPNSTSIENYRFYIQSARELLKLEPYGQAEKGWKRMAF
jgi:hypothetical protein